VRAVGIAARFLPALLCVVMLLWRFWPEPRPTPAPLDAKTARASAKQAAARAVSDCVQQPGPDGSGHLEFCFEPGGAATQVRILPHALGASPRGACIERVFRFEASVPAFAGDSDVLSQAIEALPRRPLGAVYPRSVPLVPEPANGFDWSAAGLALQRAARQVTKICQAVPGGPTGSGRVVVEFGNNGQSQDVRLRDEQFQGTPTGRCILERFALVSVPPFAGNSNPVLQPFFIGDGPGPAPAFDYEAAARALANHPPPFDATAAKPGLEAAAREASDCNYGDAWGWGEIQVDYTNYGRVNHARLLSERFDGTRTGNCIANAFRSAQVPVFSGPSQSFVHEFELEPEPSRRFDADKASQVVVDAARLAASCTTEKGPRGTLEVGVRFDRDGSVKRALVISEAFLHTATKSCVEMVFRRLRVLPFDGPAPALFQQVVLQ